MHDAETRALRRAVAVLLAVSAARWALAALEASPEPGEAGSVLPELTRAVAEGAAGAERRARPLGTGERIDPNRAPEEELDRLPGVGPALARAIAEARTEGVVFRRPEELEAVRGIGPALVGRIRPHLDLSDPPRRRGAPGWPASADLRVDLNRADPEALRTLPGIGPALAARIVEHRGERPFETVEELLEVRGIGPATLSRLRERVTVGPVR